MTKVQKVLASLCVALLLFPALAQGETVRKRARCWYAAASTNADILSDSAIGVSTAGKSVALRVTVALVDTASVFNMTFTRTDSSGNSETQTFGLNGSVALSAGDLFTFTVGLEDKIDDADDAQLLVNFQCETTTTVGYLSVQEVQSP